MIMDAFMVFNFIPGIAIYMSLYSMMSKMHLTGGRASLILPYIAWQIPFSMYIIKQYFETIPEELIESGYIRRKGGSKKVKVTSRPFHYVSSDGYDIYVGKNNYQNDEQVRFRK